MYLSLSLCTIMHNNFQSLNFAWLKAHRHTHTITKYTNIALFAFSVIDEIWPLNKANNIDFNKTLFKPIHIIKRMIIISHIYIFFARAHHVILHKIQALYNIRTMFVLYNETANLQCLYIEIQWFNALNFRFEKEQ